MAAVLTKRLEPFLEEMELGDAETFVKTHLRPKGIINLANLLSLSTDDLKAMLPDFYLQLKNFVEQLSVDEQLLNDSGIELADLLSRSPEDLVKNFPIFHQRLRLFIERLPVDEQFLRALGVVEEDIDTVKNNLKNEKRGSVSLLISGFQNAEDVVKRIIGRPSAEVLWAFINRYQVKPAEDPIPRFRSRTVISVMGNAARLKFVPRHETENIQNRLCGMLAQAPSASARDFSVPALEGPMGIGKTRAAIEACEKAAKTFTELNRQEVAPLILYIRLNYSWENEVSDGLALLAKVLMLSAHEAWASGRNIKQECTFDKVKFAIKRDGFTKVLLHVDEMQVDRKLVGKIIEACEQTMTNAELGLVVIPVLSGISLPNRKIVPSGVRCSIYSLRGFDKQNELLELFQSFCERISIALEAAAKSPNLQHLFNLCGGNPHIVAKMADVIVDKSSQNAHFRSTLDKLDANGAENIYRATLVALQLTYGRWRWHALIRSNTTEKDHVQERQSWKDYTSKMLKWLFCEAFLGETIESQEKRIGTTDQSDTNFPTYSDCVEAGLFSISSNKKINMPVFTLMLLDDMVSVLPNHVNNPFHKNWETIEWVGGASLFVRLKLARMYGQEFVSLKALRPDGQANLFDISLRVPLESELRFVHLGGVITGEKGKEIMSGDIGNGGPVAFRYGLIALTHKGQEAADCIALMETADGNSLVVWVNQSKERLDNVDNGRESISALYNGTIKKYFNTMQTLADLLSVQFNLSEKRRVVVDVFSDRHEPVSPLNNLNDVKDVSYCITRRDNFEKVVGPGFSVLCRKRQRLLSVI